MRTLRGNPDQGILSLALLDDGYLFCGVQGGDIKVRFRAGMGRIEMMGISVVTMADSPNFVRFGYLDLGFGNGELICDP